MREFRPIASIFAFLALTVFAAAARAGNGCVMESWGRFLVPGDQSHETAEAISVGEKRVIAVRFGPLEGDLAKVFLFLLDNGSCYEKAVVVGSYGFSQASYDGPGRLYHADLYEPDIHSTLGFYPEKPPAYEAARELALEVLQ